MGSSESFVAPCCEPRQDADGKRLEPCKDVGALAAQEEVLVPLEKLQAAEMFEKQLSQSPSDKESEQPEEKDEREEVEKHPTVKSTWTSQVRRYSFPSREDPMGGNGSAQPVMGPKRSPPSPVVRKNPVESPKAAQDPADVPIITKDHSSPSIGKKESDRPIGRNESMGSNIDRKTSSLRASGSTASDGVFVYFVTLVKEPEESLGISISWAFPETCLSVAHVGDGAASRWNAANPEAAIAVGHVILAVNDIADPCEAAREMSTQKRVVMKCRRPPEEA